MTRQPDALWIVVQLRETMVRILKNMRGRLVENSLINREAHHHISGRPALQCPQQETWRKLQRYLRVGHKLEESDQSAIRSGVEYEQGAVNSQKKAGEQFHGFLQRVS